MKAGRLALLCACLLLAGCDRTADGRAAWQAGKRAEALEFFRRAALEAGGNASPELLHDLALAALANGAWDEAEEAARRAAAEGGAPFEGFHDFVRGNVAFARSEAAEKAANAPGADPSLPERAMAHAEDALARWRLAAASRWDWPEARRNVERALIRIDRLRERRKEGGKDPQPPPGPPPPPPPEPPVVPPPGAPSKDGPEVERGRLPEAEVARLMEVLREQERRKQATRRTVRETPAPGVGKDW